MIEDDKFSTIYDYRSILQEVWNLFPSDYLKDVVFKESEEKTRPYFLT